jgi:hypothetical protein
MKYKSVLRFAGRWNSVCSPVRDRPALLSFACAKGLSSIARWRALRPLLEDGGS